MKTAWTILLGVMALSCWEGTDRGPGGTVGPRRLHGGLVLTTTATRGEDLDPDGYLVVLERVATSRIGVTTHSASAGSNPVDTRSS